MAVEAQSYAAEKILVINNGSTDGTGDWLRTRNNVSVVNLEPNTGASGGFYHGLKNALLLNTDLIWVMDDDTICEEHTLLNLVNKFENIDQRIGFIGSKCNWIDGNPHLMNIPDIKPHFNKTIPFNKYDQFDLVLTESNSWVSMLLNTEAVRIVGLPYKEFFFWSDDLEYTQRITSAGYLGFYSTNSIVVHKTFINYCPDFYRDSVTQVWKYKYGFRNEFFLKKKKKGFIYFLGWLFVKTGYTSYQVLKIRKDNRLKFIKVLFQSAWTSLFFDPQIDQVGA